MKKFALYLCCLLFLTVGFSNAQNPSSAVEVALLNYLGKMNDAMPVANKLIDSLRRVMKRKPEEKETYFSMLRIKSYMLQRTGNFTGAEQLIRQSIAERKEANESEYKDTWYWFALDQLARLYQEMGNIEGEQRILEEMVTSQYWNEQPLSNKQLFISWYIEVFRSGGDEIVSTYLPMLSQFDNPPKNKEELMKMLPPPNSSLEVGPNDSTAVLKALAAMWESMEESKREGGDEVFDMSFMYKMYNTGKPKRKVPIGEQQELLRQGLFKFTAARKGINFNDPWDEVKRLFLLYKKQKNYVAAEALMRQALINDELHPEEGPSAMNSLFKATLPPEAVDTFVKTGLVSSFLFSNMQQMTGLSDKYGGVDVFTVQNQVLLALLYKETGKQSAYQQLADTIYQQCKKMDTVQNDLAGIVIADIYYKIGKEKDAGMLYQRIIDNYQEKSRNNAVPGDNYVQALQRVADIYKLQGRYTEAKNVFMQALEYDKKRGADKYPDHLRRLLGLAQLYENTNDMALAEKYLNMTLAPVMNGITGNFSLLSEQEKIAFLKNETAAFDFAASLLLTNKQASDSFVLQTYNNQLALKGLVLNDEKNVFEHIRGSGNAAAKKQLNDWQNTRSAIAWQYSQPRSRKVDRLIDSLSRIANDQEKQINQLAASYLKTHSNVQPRFKEIQESLTSGQAAIDFVRFRYYRRNWTDSIWYAAFVTVPGRSVPYFVPLCEESAIAKIFEGQKKTTISYITEIYGDGINPGENKKPGRKSDQLYKLVWAPLMPYLKDVRQVAASPAGLLCRVNFDALPYDQQHYLIDQYDIRLYNNIRNLAADREKTQTSKVQPMKAILYGNINYGMIDSGRQLPSLSNSSLEIKAVSALLRTGHYSTDTITGKDATEESLKQLSGRSPDILHIATHGFSIPAGVRGPNQDDYTDNPMFRSGITMAGVNKVWNGGLPTPGREDGVVSAYEIAGLDLSNTALMVLSSCETALGEIRDNEGVFGLQRAIKISGVPNLLVGLWSLPDEQTMQLMTRFYSNKIEKGVISWATAFHDAQKELRKQHPPYKWAGMVFIE